MRKYTQADLKKAFDKWRDLDRTSFVDKKYYERIQAAWNEYVRIRDILFEKKPMGKYLSKSDLEAFDEDPPRFQGDWKKDFK